MRKHTLYIMCGVPGSGKSTWAHKQNNAKIISRDEIRFKMVKEGEDYFSKEKQVFKTFIKEIQDAIDNDPRDVYCDATHITTASRNKLLNALNLSNAGQIIVVVVRPSLQETLKRNSQRDGRRYVPKKVIRNMYYKFQRPEYDEPRIFDTLYVEVPEE